MSFLTVIVIIAIICIIGSVLKSGSSGKSEQEKRRAEIANARKVVDQYYEKKEAEKRRELLDLQIKETTLRVQSSEKQNRFPAECPYCGAPLNGTECEYCGRRL